MTSVKNGVTAARVLNPTCNDLTLKHRMHLGEFYHVEDSDLTPLPQKIVNVAEANTNIPVPAMSLDDSPITVKQRAELSKLLHRFSGVFSKCKKNTGK